jgi:hypothetical protein
LVKPSDCGCTPEVLVVRDVHRGGGVAPGGGLAGIHAEQRGEVRVPHRHLGSRAQVARRHEVGEDVVVGDGAVLVRTGDPVDAELPVHRPVPSDIQSRAVCTSRSTPISRSSCTSLVAATCRASASAMSALMWKAAVPAGQ